MGCCDKCAGLKLDMKPGEITFGWCKCACHSMLPSKMSMPVQKTAPPNEPELPPKAYELPGTKGDDKKASRAMKAATMEYFMKKLTGDDNKR